MKLLVFSDAVEQDSMIPKLLHRSLPFPGGMSASIQARVKEESIKMGSETWQVITQQEAALWPSNDLPIERNKREEAVQRNQVARTGTTRRYLDLEDVSSDSSIRKIV